MRSFFNFLVFAIATLPLTTWSASKIELDARVRAAVNSMYTEVPASRELAQKAAGMLVFPRIIKGGVGIGGELGEGALLINNNTVQYYRLTALSFGFQLGGQAFAFCEPFQLFIRVPTRFGESLLTASQILKAIPHKVEIAGCYYLDGRLNLDEMISQRIPLDDVNPAFDKMRKGEVARSVIVFNSVGRVRS